MFAKRFLVNFKLHAGVAAMLAALPLAAQEKSPDIVRDGVLSGPASTAPQVSARAPENAAVGEIIVQLERDAFVADGITRVAVQVNLVDRKGQPLKTPATITIESTARVLLSNAQTDETGPGSLDKDKVTPGTQLIVENGSATFWLLAPAVPQDVKLRVTAGEATAEGIVSFNPELRQMLAVGLIEGVISMKSKKPAEIYPARMEDGFEQDLRDWSRKFSNDRGTAGVRAAFFLKGKIKGDALLTMSYDSDKETRKRLMRDVREDEYYPVYGDASIKGFDAQSASKLYVRIDKDRHYVMYGDFQTSANYAPIAGGRLVAPLKLRDLGQYNRTMTGVRGHYEFGPQGSNGYANAFVTRDTLKQVVEEYPANGTSGPFAVRNNTGIAGTEKVEVITRDRNNPSVILSVDLLLPGQDYSFEPFSGRLLLNRPEPSLDPNGNPRSIRITYEVDQGGDPFWIYGLDGQFRIGRSLELGGSFVDDRNDLAPYRLSSVNFGVRVGDHTQLIAEVARSEGQYNTGTGLNSNLTPGLNSVSGDASGNAGRIALEHKSDKAEARLYAGRSDKTFDNQSASFANGRGDAGVRGKYNLTDDLALFGEAVRSEDRVADGTRTGAQLGAAYKFTERLTVDVAVKHMEENGKPVAPGAAIAQNPSSQTGTTNSALTPSGGFFGTGNDQINPSTGTTVLTPATVQSSAGSGTELDATTLQIGAQYKLTDRWTLAGEGEHDITGDDKRRFALGAGYRFAERSRLYGKFETQQGLASNYSLNPSDKSTSFILGADTTYAGNTQVYSEYRLRDALGGEGSDRDSQIANGLRNTWSVSPGLTFVTGAEYLRVLSGGGQKAYALVGGVDYTANALWKGSARLEWRRLEDDLRTAAVNEEQDSYLSTVSVARKLDRNWTLLTRNYLLFTDFAASGQRLQDRFQIGFAYRPVDHNLFNVLSKYEFKVEKDSSGLPTSTVGIPGNAAERFVHIFSTHGDFHPSRPWWLTGRVAAKHVDEKFPEKADRDKYFAYLLGGRVVYDVTENWDLGLQSFMMASPEGNARQYAVGLEVGYLVKTNAWVSLGYNVTGFYDRDLTGSDYTQQGFYLRLRFKFDENLFRGSDTNVNRALDRPAQ